MKKMKITANIHINYIDEVDENNKDYKKLKTNKKEYTNEVIELLTEELAESLDLPKESFSIKLKFNEVKEE